MHQPLPPGATPARNEQNVGFAGNINRAAQRARGDYLLLLNQDCRATPYEGDGEAAKRLLKPGWADAMLRVFLDHEDAGIVGPRLIFPTGEVQSVGGLFDFGKGPYHRYLGWSQPDDRRINRTEPVSWITGAAIMIRRADFLALGGLDGDTYIRGYFEDVDLCMRVRFTLGKKVYYCAEATLVHEVGSTGGNPYFMQNSRRFHERWDAQIQPDSPFVYVGY
jgi:GT2 family glycosyltransferase